MRSAPNCPACAFQNEADAKFCANCGGRLEVITLAGRPASSPAAVPAGAGTGGAVPQTPQAQPAYVASDGRGVAVALELIPLFAVGGYLLSILAVEAGFGTQEFAGLWWLFGLALLLSGAGWISVGRAGLGCSLMAGRAVALVVALVAFGYSVGWACEGAGCSGGELIGAVAMIGGLAALIVVPIVSAVAISRHAGGGDTGSGQA
jgi:hypothetical protein